MAMQLPSSSGSSSISNDFIYDVFISFRGPDTRFGFTGNLYKALSDKGIHTFIDDEELQRGDRITPSLLKSIEDSRIAIIVFSKNYASSSFCLDELAHIIHHFEQNGRLVLPVFYGVDPTDVRHQSGSYGEALAKHNKKNMDRFQKWKEALSQAANLSGHHIKLGTEYEYKSIEKIVKDVFNKINPIPLHVPDYLVGLEPRILEVNSLLELGSNDRVCIIGILGTGGIGKTTLARAVYNSIAKQFEGSCFLPKVRETSITQLQEQLLSNTIRMNTTIRDVYAGTQLIKERLPRKKILLILDDVDKLEQLQSFVPNMLGSGSKVIVTTRDKHLLSYHEIDKIYEADGLNKEQALELLRKVAFKSNKNDSSYDSILNRAVKYASGLPLALEVVGSNLSGRSVEECEFLLDKYERIPDKNILKTLKVSFDALEDDQKSVFLDIACFFKGCNLASIKEELQSHYDHDIKIDLTVLVEKSLIKINTNHYNEHWVSLHDLIEDMGKEIVRQESPNNPGERSRLWFYDDIVKVLEEDMGTAHIKIIYLICPSKKSVIEWNGNAFKKMTNLEKLVIKNVDFSKVSEYLPSGLRVLRLEGCPSMSPSSFIWNKKFNYMKVLTLINCKYLIHVPDVSGLPNLEKFSFQKCYNLITIHNSIGYLNKLEILDASGCYQLESFPPLRLPSLKKFTLYRCESLITIDNSVGCLDKLEILDASGCKKLESFPSLRLPSLKELYLNWCWSLKRFPELLCKMTKIKEISLFGTPIEDFPTSFQNLSEIRCLNMCYEYNEWFLEDNEKMNSSQNVVLSKVEYLYLACCSISDKCLQMLLKWCLNVTRVDLSGSNLKNFPECLRECHLMRILKLDYCMFLEEIRGFPPNLEEFSALECYSLSSSSRRMLLSEELHEAGYKKFCFQTDGIPDWFEHQSRGHTTISFWFRNKIPSINVIILRESGHRTHNVKLYVNDCPRDLPEGQLYGYYYNIEELPPKHAFLFDLKLEEVLLENEWITVMLKLNRNVQMGIHVWKQKNNPEEDVIFNNPYSSDTEEDDDESKILEVSETETLDLISSVEQIGIHEESNTDEDVILNNPFSRKRKNFLSRRLLNLTRVGLKKAILTDLRRVFCTSLSSQTRYLEVD